MWNLISEYRTSGISAQSYKSRDDLIDGDFSVGIFFSSFESRGLVASSLLRNRACETTIIVFFKEMDNKGLRKKYDDLLYKQVKKVSTADPILIKNRSITEVEEILGDILLSIPEEAYSNRRQWFIDTSVSPKPFFLGLLGYLRQRIESPALTMFNSTGYYEKSGNLVEAFSFTEGFEEYLWIPGFGVVQDPRLPWTYFFLLGFEGDRSYGTFDRFEPEDVKALISDPGYMPNYLDVARERNRQFLDEACPDIIYSDAGDPVETWKKIDESLEKDRHEKNICIVPLGPKPHAIGGCLSALTDGVASVLYLMPRSFKVRDIPRGEYIWKYELTL